MRYMQRITHEHVKIGVIDVHETMEQLRTVFEAENEIRDNLTPAISRLEASADEARLWWSAHDPLYETQSFLLDAGYAKFERDCSILHDTEEYYAVLTVDMTKAGLAIFSEILTGYNLVELSKATNLRRQTEDGDKIDLAQVVELFTEVLTFRTEYNNEELEMIDVAQELIAVSAKQIKEYLKSNRFVVGHMSQEEVRDFFEKVGLLSSTAHQLIHSAINLSELSNPDMPKEYIDQARLRGLRAAVQLNAAIESTSASDEQSDRYSLDERKEALNSLIQSTRQLFDNPDSTMWQRLKMSHIKGPLHETLWYLDTAMLKYLYPERYDKLAVWPAKHNADRPKIGKPTWNRSYDYSVHLDDDVHFFQLKSSRQAGKNHSKTYHPAVVPLEEDNFKELQPARLRAKLRAYQSILEGSLPKEETEKLLEKYVMDTAFFALESSVSGIESRQKQMKKILQEHYLPGLTTDGTRPRLNRQQRRALEKQNKKKGKKI